MPPCAQGGKGQQQSAARVPLTLILTSAPLREGGPKAERAITKLPTTSRLEGGLGLPLTFSFHLFTPLTLIRPTKIPLHLACHPVRHPHQRGFRTQLGRNHQQMVAEEVLDSSDIPFRQAQTAPDGYPP